MNLNHKPVKYCVIALISERNKDGGFKPRGQPMTNQDKPVELPPIDHDAESFNIGRLPALEMAQKSLANNSKAPKEEEFYPCEPDIFVATYEPVKP